jgi:hypothetical protein
MRSRRIAAALLVAAATLLSAGLRATPAAAAGNVLSNHRVESLASFGGRIFAGTDSGLYVLGSNGAWTAVGGPIAGREVAALAVSGSWLVAGTESGVLRSGDGTTWTASGLNGAQVDSLSASGGTLLAGTGTEAGGNGFVRRSDDSGATWTSAPLTPALSGLPGQMVQAVLVANGSSPAWAGTAGGGALRSADGSGSWSSSSGMQSSEVTAFWRDPASASRVLGGTDMGLYSWNGSTWTAVSVPTSQPVWVQALATGADGHVLLGDIDGDVFAQGSGGGWTLRAHEPSSVFSLLVSGGGILVGTDAGVACISCPASLAAAASPGPKRSGSATAHPATARPGSTAAAGSSASATGPALAGASSDAAGGASSGGTTGTTGDQGGGGSLRWWIVGGLVALSAVLLLVGRLRSRKPATADGGRDE